MDTQNVLEKGRAALLLLSNKILSILNSRVLRGGLSTLIIIDLVAVILQSFSDLSQYRFVFSFITVISGLVFFVEYILRIISSPALFSDLGIIRSRLKYIFSFLGIIDFISILPFSVVFFHEGHILKDFIDLARILLIFKMLRYSNTYKMIFEVLHSVKYELITAMMFSALMICFSAILMYYIERDAQPDVFKNVGVGFWWAIITYTTVGYGDTVPITALGKVLASFIALIGIITLMLPTGIVSGALMSRLQQENKKRIERIKTKKEKNLLKRMKSEKVQSDEKKKQMIDTEMQKIEKEAQADEKNSTFPPPHCGYPFL